MGKFLHGVFDDDRKLIEGVKSLKEAGIHIKEIYTPYPVHGLDVAAGIPRTRLGICAFIYGMIGVSLCLLMMTYMMIWDWPMDIGGKPSFTLIENLTAFVPILFESGVFCAAHGMALTFLLRSWVLPGVSAKNPDLRTTDDMHLIELSLDKEEADKAKDILTKCGAAEVNEK